MNRLELEQKIESLLDAHQKREIIGEIKYIPYPIFEKLLKNNLLDPAQEIWIDAPRLVWSDQTLVNNHYHSRLHRFLIRQYYFDSYPAEVIWNLAGEIALTFPKEIPDEFITNAFATKCLIKYPCLVRLMCQDRDLFWKEEIKKLI